MYSVIQTFKQFYYYVSKPIVKSSKHKTPSAGPTIIFLNLKDHSILASQPDLKITRHSILLPLLVKRKTCLKTELVD